MIIARIVKYFILLGITILLAACVVEPAARPTLTPTILNTTESMTATPTIIWFPATATYTPFPTPIVTPTKDMRPLTGEVIFEDDFSSKEGWTLTQTEKGSVAYGKDELTIAIGESNAYLLSIRESPEFSDFYLEITAAPNLCRELDEYGVLFRVSAANDYYRYSLSCNGQVRLDRVSGGQASSPQPWLWSGDVPPGAPSSSRLGVYAEGEEMSFYINGQYQFSINDPLLSAGSVGVFARSTNDLAVTVNFSDMVVYDVDK